jgi:hypothetical protein
VSELNPDPVFDKLARFSPSEASLDPAEILFRAGRASAHTPRVWKIAVVGLLLTTIGLTVFVSLRGENKPVSGSPDVVPVLVVVPVAIPAAKPNSPPDRDEAFTEWSLGTLRRTIDPNEMPRSPAMVELSPADPPLTPRLRGEID